MDQELEQVFDAITTERNNYITEFMKKNPGLTLSFSDMEQGFMLHKLAEFELRLRRLEKGNARAQSYLNLHTPLI
jgi:hypothetical protein